MRSTVAVVVVAALMCLAAASIHEDFEEWMSKFDKKYDSVEEKMYRMKVFGANLQRIAELNAANTGVQYGVNAFADRTEQELKKKYTARATFQSMEKFKANRVVAPHADVSKLPKEFNWVDKGAVTSVKDQEDCGSCWAFGAVGTMEGQLFLNKGTLIDLSEQNLVDCDDVCQEFPDWGEVCDEGCDGGMEPNAFQWVIQNGGINTLEDYPYEGEEGECRFDKSKAITGFKNWTYVVVKEEDDLRQYLYDHGPVSVGVHADEWFYYSGGIFDSKCKTENDHAVLLTGWGEKNGTPYWIIKNSWGTSWGIDGYIHLIRNKNKCGILEMMSQIHF